MLRAHYTFGKFLSRLFGGKPQASEFNPVSSFLSRLFGGKLQLTQAPVFSNFLSRLFGGKRGHGGQ